MAMDVDSHRPRQIRCMRQTYVSWGGALHFPIIRAGAAMSSRVPAGFDPAEIESWRRALDNLSVFFATPTMIKRQIAHARCVGLWTVLGIKNHHLWRRSDVSCRYRRGASNIPGAFVQIYGQG